MTRDEYVEWCKVRAREYLTRRDVANAVTSMMSDMNKREDTKVNQALVTFAMLAIMQHDVEGARRFIEGFR